MITLEQEQTTARANANANANAKRLIQDSEESFSATLKKAIDISTNNNNDNEIAENELNNKRFYYSSGPYNFLIEKDLKAETLKNMTINLIPFTPEWFMGIVSIRGVIMPVINICEFINNQTKSAKKPTKKAIDKLKQPQDERNQEPDYLLKLEHNAHSPIVIKIDKLPEQLNISNIKKRKVAKTKPDWMLHTMTSGTASITEIDHHTLLNQIKQLS